MATVDPSTRTAVIAWVGYTTPVGLGPDAATARLADGGSAGGLEEFPARPGRAAGRSRPRRSCARAELRLRRVREGRRTG